MNGGEQYSLDMALLKIREEKRKRKKFRQWQCRKLRKGTPQL